jgi:hypothetical protein
MKYHGLGLIELIVVLMFAVGWGVLELVTLRMDRRRCEEASRGVGRHESVCDSRHSERQ